MIHSFILYAIALIVLLIRESKYIVYKLIRYYLEELSK